MEKLPVIVCFLSLLPLFLDEGCMAAKVIIANYCGYTVWPGILSNAGTATLPTTGFVLQQGESRTLDLPASWSGRLWGRTHCSTDSSSGAFTCGTGDCGSSKLECSGSGAAPPATLAEFTLDGDQGKDFYDVSLVDGYNIPMLIVPQGAPAVPGVNCTSTGCLVDLNGVCPTDLKVVLASSGNGVGEGVACKSACEAFGSPEYCCSGAYGNPNTCRPSSYSQFFKNACPRAYSYAYDDSTSTFTCPTGANYVITFCPSTTSRKAGESNPQAVVGPLGTDGGTPSMIFYGGQDVSGASAKATVSRLLSVVMAVVVGKVAAGACATSRPF